MSPDFEPLGLASRQIRPSSIAEGKNRRDLTPFRPLSSFPASFSQPVDKLRAVRASVADFSSKFCSGVVEL